MSDRPLAANQKVDALLKAKAERREDERREGLKHKLIGFGVLVSIVGCAVLAVLIDSSLADAKIEGALQYPPSSVGEDAQPPPPARMVPQIVSPRRIELGVSGSSQPPVHHPYRVRSPADIDRLPTQRPLLGTSPVPAPTTGGN
jgi:hypothetical protein